MSQLRPQPNLAASRSSERTRLFFPLVLMYVCANNKSVASGKSLASTMRSTKVLRGKESGRVYACEKQNRLVHFGKQEK